MNATLSLHDSRMAAEDLQELTAELLRSIRQETELTAKLPEERGGSGAKGDAVTIGQIVGFRRGCCGIADCAEVLHRAEADLALRD